MNETSEWAKVAMGSCETAVCENGTGSKKPAESFPMLPSDRKGVVVGMRVPPPRIDHAV